MPEETKTYFHIFGRKSTAIEIAETAAQIHPEWQISYVSDDPTPCSDQVHVLDSDLRDYIQENPGKHRFIISMSNQRLRSHYSILAQSLNLEAESIIHPQTTVSPSTQIGKGTYLAPGCRISSMAVIGEHSVINLNVTFGHHSLGGPHLIANPGASIGGNVRIGQRVLIGANSFVYQGLTIGDDCQIDAMTYVGQDLKSGSLCSSRQFKIFPRREF